MTTTFLCPSFNKSEKDKIHNSIDVLSEHVLVKSCDTLSVPAIASEGFSANGTYVFVTQIDETKIERSINIGFTSTKTIDCRSELAYPSKGGLNGLCFNVYTGCLLGGTGEVSCNSWNRPLQPGGSGAAPTHWMTQYLHAEITQSAKEIIAILTICENEYSAQFIADCTEGPVLELSNNDFENKNGGNDFPQECPPDQEINRNQNLYPVVTLARASQKLEFVPFKHVKSRSPRIEELMKQFFCAEQNNDNEQDSPKKTQIKKTGKKVAASKPKIDKKKTAKKVAKSIKKAGKKIAKKTSKSAKKVGKKTAKK